MKRIGLLAAFAALCAVAGASMAHAFAVMLWPGLLAGLAIGLLPAALPAGRWHGVDAARCAELASFALLIAVAAALSARGLLPVLNDAPVRLEAAVPLLLMAPALYATYFALNRTALAERAASVADRLAAALSGPPLLMTLALATTIATGAVLLIHYVGLAHPAWAHLAAKFVARGIIPPLTLVLFFWGLLLLANKTWALWRERRLLARPSERGASVLLRAHGAALAAGEADDFLDLLWKKSADFYVVPRYINWAIPILGFIGTVLGISLAADGIQTIIGSRGSLSDLSSELGKAIAPLGIAFDTTLIALSLSVFLMLLQTALQRFEDNVLVDYESHFRAIAVRREA